MPLCYIASGIIAIGVLMYALLVWVFKLRRISAEQELAAIDRDSRREFAGDIPHKRLHTSTSPSRTEALFEFLVMVCALCPVIREFPPANVLLLLAPADSVFELSTFSIAIRVIYSYSILTCWMVVSICVNLYGARSVFDWWMGMMEPFFDLFENIHMCGKQIASIFYDTRVA